MHLRSSWRPRVLCAGGWATWAPATWKLSRSFPPGSRTNPRPDRGQNLPTARGEPVAGPGSQTRLKTGLNRQEVISTGLSAHDLNCNSTCQNSPRRQASLASAVAPDLSGSLTRLTLAIREHLPLPKHPTRIHSLKNNSGALPAWEVGKQEQDAVLDLKRFSVC